MTNSSFFKSLFFAFTAIAIVSCDTDYNNIGADIIDDDIHFGMTPFNARLTAYDRATGAVQSNNMDVNMLGVLDNPVFGKTTAHFVTQLELDDTAPTLTNPEIDSVYLYVPFHSRLQSTDSNGNSSYELDSIYGDINAQFRLAVYRNGYFLRNTNPGDADSQVYYSNDLGLIEANKGPSLLENGVNGDFATVSYLGSQIKREADKTPDDNVSTTEVVERLAPGFFLYLKKDYFQEQLLEAGDANLVNNNVFKNYFRGLYFKVEQIGSQSIMGVPKFNQGTITIRFTDDKLDANGDPVDEDGEPGTDRESRVMTINLAGNNINFIENAPAADYANAITSSDPVNGDERLYVKGGDGSLALIGINEDDINFLRQTTPSGHNKLINEANILFYIDEEKMAGTTAPLRVYLYDVDNKRPLYDYYTDITTNSSSPKENKYIHGGLKGYVDSNKNGTQDAGEPTGYKIRITNHINNIVNKDSTNVRLGLVVTETINNVSNAKLRTALTEEGGNVEYIPAGSVMHPFGTVLYGSNPAVPEDRRLKLEIYYTEPND